MKKRLVVIAIVVLVGATAAYALPGNAPGNACNVAPSWLVAAFNAVLTALGYAAPC